MKDLFRFIEPAKTLLFHREKVLAMKMSKSQKRALFMVMLDLTWNEAKNLLDQLEN